jgi:hypothetical protein
MSRYSKISLLLLILGVAAGGTALCVPDTHRWWIILWMVGIQLLFAAAATYHRGRVIAQDRRDAASAAEADPEIARIAERITGALPCEEALRDEHQLEQARWDSYEGAYVLRCGCGYVCGAPDLAEVATTFAEHHLAYVRTLSALRRVHESTSPILEKDSTALGAEMDKDWTLLSPKQKKEVSMLSVEIAWRLDTRRGIKSESGQ